MFDDRIPQEHKRKQISLYVKRKPNQNHEKQGRSIAKKSFLFAAKGLVGPLQLFLSTTALSTVLQELSGPSGESGS